MIVRAGHPPLTKAKSSPSNLEMPQRRPMMDMTQDDKSDEEARLYIVLGNIDWDLH